MTQIFQPCADSQVDAPSPKQPNTPDSLAVLSCPRDAPRPETGARRSPVVLCPRSAPESRMRENRQSGSEGGEPLITASLPLSRFVSIILVCLHSSQSKIAFLVQVVRFFYMVAGTHELHCHRLAWGSKYQSQWKTLRADAHSV